LRVPETPGPFSSILSLCAKDVAGFRLKAAARLGAMIKKFFGVFFFRNRFVRTLFPF
jgi:hypothetical protein